MPFTRLLGFALLAALLLGPGCGSGGAQAPAPVVQPPTSLTYTINPEACFKGLAIDPDIPGTTGGVPSSYAVSPALPAGLTLNASTGVISGTPTATGTATPTATASPFPSAQSWDMRTSALSRPSTRASQGCPRAIASS